MSRDVLGDFRAGEEIKPGALVGFERGTGHIVNHEEPKKREPWYVRAYRWLHRKANQ